MKRKFFIVLVTVCATLLSTSNVWSRGGRGGGARPAMGGGARPAARGPAMPNAGARTPSMSRAMPRPAGQLPTTRPAVAQRPAAQRPATQRPATQRPATRPTPPTANRPNVTPPNASRPNIGQPIATRPNVTQPRPGNARPLPSRRPPSAGDLGDFLDLPGGNRPTTLPATRPGSGNRPSGNLPRPDVPGRPGVGNRPSPGTPPIANNRPGVTRPNTGDRVNVGQINIDRENNINTIRNRWSYADRRPFNPNWWANHPTTLPANVHGWRWHQHWGRYPYGWCWRPATWATFGTWFAWTWATPMPYNYGTNVVYRDNYVYVNEQQVATSEVFYQQAATIAAQTPEEVNAEQTEWLPLGVFAIAGDDGVDTGMLVQLAVSKDGIIAGTFYNDATDEGKPIEGSVDRETQRAAWKFVDGSNNEIVMETGIYNLTQEEATALVHFGPERSETWLMVRLPEPEAEDEAKP